MFDSNIFNKILDGKIPLKRLLNKKKGGHFFAVTHIQNDERDILPALKGARLRSHSSHRSERGFR